MAHADTSTASDQLRYASDRQAAGSGTSINRLNLTPSNDQIPAARRPAEVLRLAQEAFAKTGSWVVFYRELLGRDGVVRQMYPDAEEFEQFQQTSAYAELQEMVAAMRSQDTAKGDAAEPERMITIRLPMSLHEILQDESEAMNLSINKLCITKLLQSVDGRFVPVQQGRRRGRKPGPQGPRKRPGQESTNHHPNG